MSPWTGPYSSMNKFFTKQSWADGLYLNYLKSSCCHSASQAKLENSLWLQRDLCHWERTTCAQLSHRECDSHQSVYYFDENTQVRKLPRFGSIPLIVATYPPSDSVPPSLKPSLPCLMASKNFPGDTPHAMHHLRPLSDCNIWGGRQGFHAECRGCPRVWTPRRTSITTSHHVNPDSDLNWLCVSPSVKWE